MFSLSLLEREDCMCLPSDLLVSLVDIDVMIHHEIFISFNLRQYCTEQERMHKGQFQHNKRFDLQEQTLGNYLKKIVTFLYWHSLTMMGIGRRFVRITHTSLFFKRDTMQLIFPAGL
jgi:hypothetical protein